MDSRISPSTRPIVLIRGLSKSYGDAAILSKLDFSAEKGAIIGIVGKSGSGKSTLLQIISGFLDSDEGDVQLFDSAGKKYVSHRTDPKTALTMCGLAAQKPSLCEKLTVRENLRYFGTLWDLDMATLEKNVPAALRLCDLEPWADISAGALSSAMQKRLDIACAIVHNPAVILLDDPFSGLDESSKGRIAALITTIRGTGATVILATSSIEEASRVCDAIALLEEKRISSIFRYDEKSVPSRILLQTREKRYRDLAERIAKKERGVYLGMQGDWFVAQNKGEQHILYSAIDACRAGGQTVVAIRIERPQMPTQKKEKEAAR